MKTSKELGPLERFEKLPKDEATLKAIAMLLWKDRYNNPEMSVQVSAENIESLNKCTAYLEVEPQVRIFRPQGRPEVPYQPATAKRSAIPAQPEEPPKPYILIQLTDKDGNNFKPIESTEEGAKIRDQHDAVRRAKDQAKVLAQQLLADLSSGAYSDSTIRDTAQILMTLAKA